MPNATAQTWRSEVSIGAEATLTNNANYGLGAEREADLIFNLFPSINFAREGGRLRVAGTASLNMIGYVDGVLHAALDLGALHAKRLTLFGVSNKLRTQEQRAAAVPRFVADVMPHVAAGRIKPQIDEVIEFARLKEGKARMEAAGHVGKIVLRMPVAA